MIRKNIAYQGEPGSNSHIACKGVYPEWTAVPCATFEDALSAISDGTAGLGMIPIENSIAGRVADIHHLLPGSGLYIVGEYFLPIHFDLLGLKGGRIGDVHSVYSHVHALGQCRKIVRQRGLTPHVTGDTAGAARLVAEWKDPGRAAIATRLAAEIYGLDVPAALYKALGGFATNGVNMTKLESYMVEGEFIATQFLADVEAHPHDPPLARAFEELAFFCKEMKILGVYPAHAFRIESEMRAGKPGGDPPDEASQIFAQQARGA